MTIREEAASFSTETVVTRPFTLQTLRPSEVIDRHNSSCPSRVAAIPERSSKSYTYPVTPSKTPDTRQPLSPVRIISRGVLAPQRNPIESMRMLLPAPVSPVRTVKPGAGSKSADFISAMFSICMPESMMMSLPVFVNKSLYARAEQERFFGGSKSYEYRVVAGQRTENLIPFK
ncbi:hypothetical protein SDC9_124324 [bioreactor metagenome]|uniref:Uncharacterized protein n=1 Tax=bioreactor metagenome TaxID=1076179 RepID=A0A645CK39_9ZZZZ